MLSLSQQAAINQRACSHAVGAISDEMVGLTILFKTILAKCKNHGVKL